MYVLTLYICLHLTQSLSLQIYSNLVTLQLEFSKAGQKHIKKCT